MNNAGLIAASQMISAASANISGGYLVYYGPVPPEVVSYPLILLKPIQEIEWGKFNVTSGSIFASVISKYDENKSLQLNEHDHGNRVVSLVKELALLPSITGFLAEPRFSIVDEILVDNEIKNDWLLWGNFTIKYGLQE